MAVKKDNKKVSSVSNDDFLTTHIDLLHGVWIEASKQYARGLLFYLITLSLTVILVFGDPGIGNKVTVPLLALTLPQNFAASITIVLATATLFRLVAIGRYRATLGKRLDMLRSQLYGQRAGAVETNSLGHPSMLGFLSMALRDSNTPRWAMITTFLMIIIPALLAWILPFVCLVQLGELTDWSFWWWVVLLAVLGFVAASVGCAYVGAIKTDE